MKFVLKSSVLAAGLAFSLLSTAAAAEPVYWVSQIEVEDFERFLATYAEKVRPMLEERNVEILTAGAPQKLLEGEWNYNNTVILKFESEAAAMDFYNSPEYVAVRPLRFATTSANNVILMNQFVMPTQ